MTPLAAARAALRALGHWLYSLWNPIDLDQYKEDTYDLLKRKAVEAGLDPTWFDEIQNLPPEPQGPDDPGEIGMRYPLR